MKAYVKPQLFYERYELSQHIADCTWNMTVNGDGDKCTGNAADKGYPADWFVFSSSNSACTVSNDILGAYCVMASTTSKVIFTS